MQLRLVVHHDLNLLAFTIEGIANGSILSSRVLLERYAGSTSLLHVLSTTYQCLNVETSASNRQQTYRSEHREAATYVVGDDETLVAFLVSAGTSSTTLGIRNGNNHLFGFLLTTLSLALLLQQTECQSGLSGCTRLGDIDNTEFLAFQVFGQLEEIVLADVVTSKENDRILLVLNQPAKRVAQCLDDGTGTQIATTNTCNNYSLAIVAQYLGCCLNLVEEGRSDFCGQMQPS